MLNVLVTGGCGFIGSNLAIQLHNLGNSVRIIDNLSTGRIENIKEIIDEIDFRRGDLQDQDAALQAVENIDIIFHQAAIPSVPRSLKDPISSNLANINGTLNILVAAKDRNVKRIVYASSSSIYGDSPELPKREDMPTNPLSPYALTKFTGEKYCQLFYSLYGLETISLRYFNVFGPRQDPSSQYAAVIPLFISAALSNKKIIIYGDGTQTRDFTFIDNVVDANISAALSDAGKGEVINIACGERVSINDLSEMIFTKVGAEVIKENLDEREGEVKHSLADISKARGLIGYSPVVRIEEGIGRTIDWYRTKQ